MSSCKINVKLKPNAKKDDISVDQFGNIVVAVTSQPIDGKANAHFVKLFSKTLRLSKSSFTIVKGMTSKNKVVKVEGLDLESIIKKIADKSK